MKIISVERETRRYVLTIGKDPKGRGWLAIISLGSPQLGDTKVDLCDLELFESKKQARKWYKAQMKTKPWLKERVIGSVPIPEGLGKITDLKAKGGKLVAELESGTSMIVPLDRFVK